MDLDSETQIRHPSDATRPPSRHAPRAGSGDELPLFDISIETLLCSTSGQLGLRGPTVTYSIRVRRAFAMSRLPVTHP
mgnify:CR=1 FL=1